MANSNEGKIEKLRTRLKSLGVDVSGTVDDFYGSKEKWRGLWVSTESGYLAEYAGECNVDKILEEQDMFLEHYDSGTAFIWII